MSLRQHHHREGSTKGWSFFFFFCFGSLGFGAVAMALNVHKASGGPVTKSGNEDIANGVAGCGGRRATMMTTATLGGSAAVLMKSSRSSYTWLDRLRYLKGFDEGTALSESQNDDAEDSWLWRSSSGVVMKSSGGGGKECDGDENTTISASSYDGRGGRRRRRMIEEEEEDDEQHVENVGRGGSNTLEPRAVWELYFGGDVMRVDNDNRRSRASLPLATAARNNNNNNNTNNKVAADSFAQDVAHISYSVTLKFGHHSILFISIAFPLHSTSLPFPSFPSLCFPADDALGVRSSSSKAECGSWSTRRKLLVPAASLLGYYIYGRFL
jgi:hypothetical protein